MSLGREDVAIAEMGHDTIIEVVVVREAVEEDDPRSLTWLIAYPKPVPIVGNSLFVHT